MFLSDNPPMIYTPTTITELMQVYRRNPASEIYAGGTWILGKQTSEFIQLSKTVIYLGKIEELKKITRTERYIEFGSCVTLADILNLKARIIPPILHSALQNIATQQIQNRATVGGNLAVKEQRMSLFPAFLVLDAKLELKKQNTSRWIDLKRFINEENHPDIMEGEILTKIRIPIDEWQLQNYNAIGERMQIDRNYQVNAWSCKIIKEQIIDLRAIFVDGSKTLFRPFQTEGNIIGKKLPFTEREISELQEIFSREINATLKEVKPKQIKNFKRLFRGFLIELSNYKA